MSASSDEPKAAQPDVALPLPYAVRREWPADWDLLAALTGAKDVPPLSLPARYLHPALEVRTMAGRGRCVVATHDLEVGELLLLDTPLSKAKTYEALLQAVTSQLPKDADFRRHLLSMCGDSADESLRAELKQDPDRTAPEPFVRNIVRHNYHAVELPATNGELCVGPDIVGLWPLGSLVNHSLCPNAARTFAGLASCYRLIRPLRAGDEVLDNYLDLRLPRSMRQEMLRSNHSIEDEGPDAFDAPPEEVSEICTTHKTIMQELGSDCSKDLAMAAFRKLVDLTNRCAGMSAKDPAFVDIFRDFALLAGQLGNMSMCLEGLALAIEYATVREPYNIISAVLAARMLHMALLAKREVDAETRKSLETVAREHFGMVYGPWPGAFEALNTRIMRRLSPRPAAVSPPAEPLAEVSSVAAGGEKRQPNEDCPDVMGIEKRQKTV